MYKHILIATDGSELADKAVLHGLELAKAVNAKVTLLTVSEPMWSTVPGEMAIAFPHDAYEKSTAAKAEKILASVAEAAKTRGLGYTAKHSREQFPAEGIVAAAQEGGCDLIVMASHGRRGLAKLVLGSQAAKVVTSSTVPVLVYREAGSS
jgi:nucleotide-binding universal stress UspA family protein